MMKLRKVSIATGLLLATLGQAWAQTTIISDNFTAPTQGTGFDLGSGVNSGIDPGATPPVTRITGVAAGDLRYLQTDTRKNASFYDIGSNRLRVSKNSSIGRFTISANGASPFDFGPVLGSPYASATNPATYDIKIGMRNDATTAARFSFGLSTAEGDVTVLDFGVQLYRAASADTFYTVQKRIDTASSGVADVNAVMGTTAAGTTGSMVNFLIRVTDAGPETNAYSSRVQVSIDNGATWFYDTAADSALSNGFRFDGPGRYLVFDQAGNTSGTVFYDNLSIVSTYAPPPPPAAVWNGNGADDNWSTSGNWSGNVPGNGAPLIFDGTNRQVNNNDLADLNTLSVTFNNGGFTLQGNPFINSTAVSNLAGVNVFSGDFSWGATGAKTWHIAGDSEVQLSNTTTVEVGGDQSIGGGGTLRLKGTMNIGVASTANPAVIVNEGKHIVDGGTFTSRGGYRIGSQPDGIGAQTILTNGATFALTASGANLRVGDSANPNGGHLIMNNSTLTMAGGSLGIPYAAGATGTVTQVGGTLSGAVIAFSDSGAGTGTYTIQNGTLEPVQIRKDNANGNASIYFNNAVLRSVSGANNAFFSGVDIAEIQSGGLILDAQSDVTIAQPLSGTGALVKSNFAAVTLTGANTYSGNTIIQSGKLLMPTIQTNTTSIQVADGAEFGVVQTKADSTLSVSALNFNGASFSTLSFDLGNFTTPTAPMMTVSSLSVSGPVYINIANGFLLTPGQFALVDYSGAISGGFQFLMGTLPPGVTATLVNNTANSSIDLNITGVPGYRWTGAVNGEWDYGTPNWIDQQNGSAAAYADNFPVFFYDGTANNVINVGTFPTPSAIIVSNNATPYTFTGFGAITTQSLKKSGTNALVRVESGADAINVIELNGGSLVLSNLVDTAFTNVLIDAGIGNGTLVKEGSSILTVSASNSTYDGAILVQSGVLKLNATDALGSTNGSTTIASGATLDLNNLIAPHEPVIVSGAGVNGQGAIVDSTTATGVANNLTDITMVGDTTIGSPNGGRWDIRVRSSTGPGPGLRGNGFNLTKVGSGSVSIASQRNIGAATPYWDMNLGNVVINEGSLAFAEALTLGNPSKTVTINAGASMQLYDLGVTNPFVRNIIMTSAKLTCGGGNSDTNVVNGSVNLSGVNEIRPDQGVFIFNSPITGSGSLNLSANEPGRIYFNAVNTYSGDTTLTNGTLGGTGVIAGNLIMQGGTNAPGAIGVVGTFTVNGNATLAGTTLMELDRSKSPNSDRLVVGGALNFGGILTVAFAPGAAAPQAGDVYQLFNKAGSSSFSAIILPDLSGFPGGLAWDTNNFSVNGTISVTGTATPPTISSVSVSGGNLILSGNGGVEGGSYTVLSSTNVALPLANWSSVATGTFGPSGSFSFTNAINPAELATFFTLQVP